MVVPYLGDTEGNFWKANSWSLTEFLHLGISRGRGPGYLEMGSMVSQNQQAQILDPPLPPTYQILQTSQKPQI